MEANFTQLGPNARRGAVGWGFPCTYTRKKKGADKGKNTTEREKKGENFISFMLLCYSGYQTDIRFISN